MSRHLCCGKEVASIQTVPKVFSLNLGYGGGVHEVCNFVPKYIPLARILATSSVDPSVTHAATAQSNLRCISPTGFQGMCAE